MVRRQSDVGPYRVDSAGLIDRKEEPEFRLLAD